MPTIRTWPERCQGEQKRPLTAPRSTAGLAGSLRRRWAFRDSCRGGTSVPGSDAGGATGGNVGNRRRARGAGAGRTRLGDDRRRRHRPHPPHDHLLPPPQPGGRMRRDRAGAGWRSRRRAAPTPWRSTPRRTCGSTRRAAASAPQMPSPHSITFRYSSRIRCFDSSASRRRVISSSRHLADRVLRRREIQVLRELLGDRAGAARELAALHVGLDRLLQLVVVDRLVLSRTRCPR